MPCWRVSAALQILEARSLPVLYLTGYTEDAIVSHGVLEEGVHLLQKPFSRTSLLRRVRALLDAVRKTGR